MTNPLRACQTEAVAHVETVPTMQAAVSNGGAGHGARSCDTKDAYIVPMTLAIRGRGDSHDLETRQDGTANAILTPNGGRGGIGVGAVALGFIPKAPPGSRSCGERVEQAPTITTHMNGQGVQIAMQVRRLTPRECERLQGFADDHTLITFNKKPVKDGPRYKALGNSMAVPVMHWIGSQIELALWCEENL